MRPCLPRSRSLFFALSLTLLGGCAATKGDVAEDPDPLDLPEAPAAMAEAPARIAPTPTPTPAPTPTPPRGFKISAVGDIMMGTTFPHETDYLLPDGPAPSLEGLKADLKGEIIFGNLEGPLIDGGTTDKCGPGQNCYAFRSPTEYADVLKDAGFTVVSIANNHAFDFGEEGRESTMASLERVGIAYSGPVGKVALLEAGNQTVALIAFTTAGHSHDFRDIEAAKALVAGLSAEHAVVIVSFHGGTEGSKALHISGEEEYLGNEHRGNPIDFAHAVIESGADLVLGHGPHVLRALEVYQGRLITYSLGNFFTYGRFNLKGPNGQAVILQADLGPDGAFEGGQLVPVLQTKTEGPARDPSKAAIPLLQGLTRDDIPTPGIVIGDDGALSLPISPIL